MLHSPLAKDMYVPPSVLNLQAAQEMAKAELLQFFRTAFEGYSGLVFHVFSFFKNFLVFNSIRKVFSTFLSFHGCSAP